MVSVFYAASQVIASVLNLHSKKSVKKSARLVAGYNLLVRDDDYGEALFIVSPQEHRFNLYFESLISSNAVTLGEKVEWREHVRDGHTNPIAMIVAVNVLESPEGGKISASYFAVCKITSDEVCLTKVIPLTKNAVEEAREAADSSPNDKCLRER